MEVEEWLLSLNNLLKNVGSVRLVVKVVGPANQVQHKLANLKWRAQAKQIPAVELLVLVQKQLKVAQKHVALRVNLAKM